MSTIITQVIVLDMGHWDKHFKVSEFLKRVMKSYFYTETIHLNLEIVDQLAIKIQISRFWSRKKKPLLSVSHEYLKSEAMYSANQLEIFSLDTWVGNVDLSRVLNSYIDCKNKSKHQYNPVGLRLTCADFIESKYCNTDGSKDSNESGLAWFDPQTKSSVKLHLKIKTSSMDIELLALAEALSYIESLEADSFVIFTDSRSALQHLARCTSSSRGAPIAYTILRTICMLLANNKQLVLQWVPSHIGLPGNEEADRLAKEAASDGIRTNYLPCHNDLIYLVKQKCFDTWKEYFDERSLSKGIWYRTIQSNLLRIPWFVGIGMDRSDVVTSLKLRSGHIPLNSFGFIMGKTQTPNCAECGVKEDVYHIMVECVRNETERRDFTVKYNCDLYDLGVINTILASTIREVEKYN